MIWGRSYKLFQYKEVSYEILITSEFPVTKSKAIGKRLSVLYTVIYLCVQFVHSKQCTVER